MRVLVTGSAGFVGRHLAAELAAHGHEVWGFDTATLSGTTSPRTIAGDACDAAAVARAVQDVRPEGAIHLAGLAFVPLGWSEPVRVFEVNVRGTLNLLEALRRYAAHTRLVVVSSGEVYGPRTDERPLPETAPMSPTNPYACSKMTADLLTLHYARRHGLPALTARPDNHIGPGQSTQFAVPSFAAQLARIARGAEPVLRVGNLKNERDFTDVRDVVRAYRLLLERGRPGEAYNVAAGRPVRVGALLEMLCEIAGVRPRIELDPERVRPTEPRPLLDTSKIRRELGWEPRIPLTQTLSDVYRAALESAQSG